MMIAGNFSHNKVGIRLIIRNRKTPVCEEVGVVSIMDFVKCPSLWFWVELMDPGRRRGVGATKRRRSSDTSS